MNESGIQSRIMLALGARPGIRIFRNQVGFGFVGEYPNQRPVSFGLAPGSGDLIGWRSRIITPDDVGRSVAQFLSVKVKSASGTARPNQRTWAEVVRQFGGIAIIARDPRTVVEEVEGIPLL